MPKVEYVIYPGLYVLLSEQLEAGNLTDRIGEDQMHRVVEIVSAWEAALQEHGDRFQKGRRLS